MSSELFRVRSGFEESSVQLGDVKRENATLCDEIKDIMEQISEGGRNIHEIEKQRKRLETEKRELQVALEDAEAALEQEENKFLRYNRINFLCEIAFLAVLNFFLVHKIDFWSFLKLQKMEFGQKKFFREIDLFDFMSFFGLDFFKFSGLLCLLLHSISFNFFKR